MEEDKIVSQIKENLSNQIDKIDSIKEKILKYSTLTLAIFSAIAYSFLFAYSASYANHFNIPSDCIVVDLKSYIQIMVQIVSIAVYLLSYFYEYISERVTKYYKFRTDRAFLLMFILYMILPKIIKFEWRVYLASIIGAFLLEAIIFLFVKWRIKKLEHIQSNTKPEVEKQLDINERGRLYAQRILRNRSRLFAILVLIYFSVSACVSLAGEAKASNETRFQIIYEGNKLYVVVLDYIDKAIVLEGVSDKFGNLQIITGEYRILNKIDKVIKQVNFFSVNLIDNTIDYAKIKNTAAISPTIYSKQTTPPIVTTTPTNP